MMASVNKVILLGVLEKDPFVRYISANHVVAKLVIITSEEYVNERDKQKHIVKEFHRVSCWQDLAKYAEKHLKKGMQIYVEGKLVTRSWKPEGSETKNYSTEINADLIKVIGGEMLTDDVKKEESVYPKDKIVQPSSIDINQDLNITDEDEIPF